MSETAPKGIGNTPESSPSNPKKGFGELLKVFVQGLKQANPNPDPRDFRTQRGLGEGAPSLDRDENTVDGLTPKQEVIRKLEELKKLEDKNT